MIGFSLWNTNVVLISKIGFTRDGLSLGSLLFDFLQIQFHVLLVLKTGVHINA